MNWQNLDADTVHLGNYESFTTYVRTRNIRHPNFKVFVKPEWCNRGDKFHFLPWGMRLGL
jgi:hypothetical protein